MDDRSYEGVERKLDALRDVPRVERAAAALRDGDEQTLRTQIELSEIPAPPFGEDARGCRLAELMSDAGLTDVHVDAVGNVVGRLAGADVKRRVDAPFVVAAHIDTVFPAGTDVRVTRDADLLRGPGISDDARGLAALLALARAYGESDCRPQSPLLFVGTVGEEGAGDLRGVKHLFGEMGAGRAASGFISLDGAGLDRIVTRGLGSTRFRIAAFGPGGHSWVDWGTPNPIHVLTEIATKLVALPLAEAPVTTLTVARWGGGTSINAIPQHAWFEVDTRSEADENLRALEKAVRGAVVDIASHASVRLRIEIETIGSRPGGASPDGDPLVLAAMAATRAVGGRPALAVSSTDANIPMAQGIPAITLGCGGEAGKAHTTDEWYRNNGGVDGLLRALYTVILASGLAA